MQGAGLGQEHLVGALFGEVVDVRVVNLEIVVTEKGERVTGLQPEDFILTVDGNEIPIEYFTEVSGGLAVESRGESPGEGIPALVAGEPVGNSAPLSNWLRLLVGRSVPPAQQLMKAGARTAIRWARPVRRCALTSTSRPVSVGPFNILLA